MQIRPETLRTWAAAHGEIAVAVRPRLAGRVDAGNQRRMNAFAGRALTAPLLHDEQNHRSRHLTALYGTLSHGIVEGLALAFFDADMAPVPLDAEAPRRMLLEPGMAIDAAGEETLLQQPLAFDALALPVVGPRWLLQGEAPPARPPVADGSVLEARAVGAPLRTLVAAARPVPRVGLVLLQATEHWQLDGDDPLDQCERDLDAEAFEDQQRREGGRLLYYPWPDEWLAPLAPDAAWRNRLAHRLFEREARLGAAEAMPWHRFGTPLALVAFDAGWRPLFADRAAVARAGGRPRPAAPRPGAGSRSLWQARIEQFAEELADHLAAPQAAGPAPATPRTIAARLRLLPPVGLLPVDAIDLVTRVNRFFPSTLELFALPVPTEQLDALLAQASGLAPIDLSVHDRIAVYVPVPQAVYTPDLLVQEQADPTGEIGAALHRFVDVRSDWLQRRQNLREKAHALQRALLGPERTPAVPTAGDDPLRLEDERLTRAVPPPNGPLYRSGLVMGLHQHRLTLDTPTAPPRGATLFVWVLTDREHPPQQLMLEFHADHWAHRVYWGANLIERGRDGSASRWQAGSEPPPAGVWTRLAVPAADVGLQGRRVDAVALTLHGGRACMGPVGLLTGDKEKRWPTHPALEDGNTPANGNAWTLVAPADRDAPFEAAYGTTGDDMGSPISLALATLLDSPDMGTLRFAAAGATRVPGPTLADRITREGLRRAVDELAAHIDQADDALNVGFLRVQTDLYRLRQSVLKQSQATRFAVSPALTQIADLDNATATREALADFYADLRADPTLLKRPEAVTAPAPLASGRSSAPLPGAAVAAPGPLPATDASLLRALNEPLLMAGTASAAIRLGAVGGAAAPPPSTRVTGADALVGKVEIRTSSIASRLERPRSIEAKDFSVATRSNLAVKLASLGLDTDSIAVPGLASRDANGAPVYEPSTGQPARTVITTLGALRAERFAPLLADPDPRDDKADESAYFLSGVDVSDATIALLRGTEGLVRRHRDALQRMRDALAEIEGQFSGVRSRMAVVGRELAEARQDVATARALLAEDQARAAALNAQRAAVLAEHVKFLAFARLRVGSAHTAVPRRDLASSLAPGAIPACLAEHHEAPADLRAMLALLRQAPLQWFPAARASLSRLDQPALTGRLLDAVSAVLPAALSPAAGAAPSANPAPATPGNVVANLSANLSIQLATVAPALQPPAATASLPGGQMAQQALRLQAHTIMAARQAALPALQAARLPGTSLNLGVQAIAQGLSLADLLRATATTDASLSRPAAREFERIEAIASCLHAELSTVRAALRLQWAEALSAYDAARGALDLGDLGLLPRFAELPRAQRERLQELAGWLRSRVDAQEPRAVALMADLLRVCVLAASHSPAGELVTGRLLQPRPLNPGLRLEVRPLLPERVHVGMELQFFDAQQVTARAVVEDLAGGLATVRVTQTVLANLPTSAATAVRFVNR
jgi:hypothetical protein